jgi:spermidine/putrescine transport system ATP-binding protein/putrescine transport system ATP-binding protein
MAQARVVQVDTPAGLYERPKNRIIAGFIGSMNFFPGRVHRRGSPEIEVEGLGRVVLNGHDHGRPDGAAATVAIRPEKMALAATAPGGRAVQGVVQARQYLGGRHMLHVGIAGRAAPVAVAVQDAGVEMAPGQPVWVTWKDDAILILDAETADQEATP